MAMTDPIADLLTRIRNVVMTGKDVVQIPSSKLKKEILTVLKDEGYVIDFQETTEGIKNTLTCKINLDGEKAVTFLEKVSKPGRRVYVGKTEIPRVLEGHGLVVLSTSKGVMSGKRARKEGIGGELICKIY